jgi:hypothetical protein
MQRVRFVSSPDNPNLIDVFDENGEQMKYVMKVDIHLERGNHHAVMEVFRPAVDLELDTEVIEVHEEDIRSKANAR